MDWENSAMMCHDSLMDSPYFKMKQQELIALAYLKSCRENVIERGFSFMASFDGRHRSGKSVTAATFGYLWDKTFWQYFENRVVQDHKEFMDVIDKIAKENIRGAVVMVDEAGISMASADWYERWMKTITKMVQMFGYLYPVILFVAPIKDFVDSRLRKMFHAYYKVERYDTASTTITPYNLKYNTIKNKWYYKKPVLRLGGQEIQLRRLRLTRPPDFILDRYRNLELSRKEVMLSKFMNEMKRSEIKDVKKQRDIKAIIEFVIANYKLFESKRSNLQRVALDATMIEYNQEIPNRLAQYVKREAERRIQEKLDEINEATQKEVKEK